MSEPINYIKVFVCDYVEDIEDAVNEYAKKNQSSTYICFSHRFRRLCISCSSFSEKVV